MQNEQRHTRQNWHEPRVRHREADRLDACRLMLCSRLSIESSHQRGRRGHTYDRAAVGHSSSIWKSAIRGVLGRLQEEEAKDKGGPTQGEAQRPCHALQRCSRVRKKDRGRQGEKGTDSQSQYFPRHRIQHSKDEMIRQRPDDLANPLFDRFSRFAAPFSRLIDRQPIDLQRGERDMRLMSRIGRMQATSEFGDGGRLGWRSGVPRAIGSGVASNDAKEDFDDVVGVLHVRRSEAAQIFFRRERAGVDPGIESVLKGRWLCGDRRMSKLEKIERTHWLGINDLDLAAPPSLARAARVLLDPLVHLTASDPSRLL